MKVHELKTWPGYFGPVLSGKKMFEYRKDDRGFAVGDILHLKEWLPITRKYSGDDIFVRITFYFSELGIQKGYCILGIETVDDIGFDCLNNCKKFPEECQGCREPSCEAS
jgi:hypothetical protein